MVNSFELILDTTGPNVTINAPKYSVLSSIANFEIIGSENLSPDQDFYFMDAAGERHDVIFSHDGNSFSGQVSFSSFSEGIAIFYGQVKDDVFNLSPVFTHSIKVENGSDVDVELKDLKREIIIRDYTREIKSRGVIRFIESDKSIRELEITERKRAIDTKESTRKMGVESDG